MLYMMEWKLKLGCFEKAHTRFLETGAPVPEDSKLIGRWHAPGSVNGWLVVETDKPETVYVHAAEWGEMVEWQTTPVLTDEQAAPASAAARERN